MVKKTKKEPEIQAEEQEVIELPVDLKAFYRHLIAARQALGYAKEALGTSAVYDNFVEEIVDVDDTMGDIKARVQQLSSLEEVLASTKFTNKSEVDAKIRQKVIEEMTKHFTFHRIDESCDDEDVIVVDDKTLSESDASLPPEAMKAAPRNLSSVRAEAKADALSDLRSSGVDISMYEHAASEQYGAVDDNFYSNLPDLDGLSPEEVQEAFPDMDPSTLKRVEQLKRLAPPKKMGSTSKVGGITRREQ